MEPALGKMVNKLNCTVRSKQYSKKLFYSFCDSQKEGERESLKRRNMKFSKRPCESTSSLINRTATESTGKSICTNYFTFSIGVYIR